MGVKVIALTSKEEKRKATLALGADDVIVWEDKDAMTAQNLT